MAGLDRVSERFTWQAWESGDYLDLLVFAWWGDLHVTVSNSDYRDDHGDDRSKNATVLEFGDKLSVWHDSVFDARVLLRYSVALSGKRLDPDMFSLLWKRNAVSAVSDRPFEPGSLLRSRFKLFDPAGEILEFGDTRLLQEVGEFGQAFHVMVSWSLALATISLTVDHFEYSNDYGSDFLRTRRRSK